MRQTVRQTLTVAAMAAATLLAPSAPAFAQAKDAAKAPAAASAKEQFIPVLSYRTGAYAPNGIPFANGFVDYLKLINARDGGINGVKITFEECETGYATDRGVECYERLKGKGPTGAALVNPLSTGITFALTDKSFGDKIPLLTGGYGLSASAEGRVFKWNFILGGSYWVAADIVLQHIGGREGGMDKLKGKKIAYVYHDSPYGKEAIPLLVERSKMHGFELLQLPVTHPGVEQKATWLQIRQQRPDYVVLWGWGVMNSTAVKEAVATGFPREKMYGGWYAGAEPDVRPAGDGAKGYTAVTSLAPAGRGKVHEDILKLLHGKNQGTGPQEEVGEILYNRALTHAMLSVEAIRRAQEKYGKKPLTGEQVRWGLENLAIDDKKIKALGFEGFMLPLSTSCADHMGTSAGMMQQWDGKKWITEKKVYQADMAIIKPMIDQAARKYAGEKKLEYRDCAKDAS
ncbi:MAG: ABC transporter substrate-binding protein [Burkholderiales bacterium]|nr:ABC transporter substrate-binding protein [Burkholderiales bacterium]